ncbi:MAG: alpha/beta fold hydrolase, partial [Candidatus Solibacter sp.]
MDSTPGDSGVPFDNITLPLQGARLAGWWVPSDAPKARTLLYLHGNAANVAANLDHVLRLRNTGLNVFIIDYRGYGHSTGGPPRENLLYADAERAWAYLVADRHIPAREIVIYGHSLGGAVAVHLGSKHPEAGGLITESTFTSVADMADGSFFAYLPLGLILTAFYVPWMLRNLNGS